MRHGNQMPEVLLLCPLAGWTVAFEQSLLRSLFSALQVPRVSLFPSSLASVLTLGSLHGLVIETGATDMAIVPVFDGRLLTSYSRVLPLGAIALTEELKRRTLQSGRRLMDSEESLAPWTQADLDAVPLATWEDCKARLLRVLPAPLVKCKTGDSSSKTQDNSENDWLAYNPPSAVELGVATVKWLFPKALGGEVSELLFSPNVDEESLGSAIAQVLCECPIDTRSALAETLYVTGGLGNIPGFEARLETDVRQVLETKPPKIRGRTVDTHALAGQVRVRRSNFKPALRPWIGASVFASVKGVGLRNAPLERDNWLASNSSAT